VDKRMMCSITLLIIGVSFSMLPIADAEVIHCHRDIECVLFMKNCLWVRFCGPKGICVCTGRQKKATPKVNESTPK
jgi:hypothetical protein